MKIPNAKKDTAPRLLISESSTEPTQEQIALRAYSLWEQQGHPGNQEVAIWLQAETQLRKAGNQHGAQS